MGSNPSPLPVAIGSGSSVGREGPIIQIGSALGSTLGQIIAVPSGQRIALVAAGAGAGIAATFNTPIGDSGSKGNGNRARRAGR
jgi:H+/Cl- antiporter ClcA